MKIDHKKSLEYYKTNQEALVSKYDGKTLVLQNENITDVCDTYSEAYTLAVKKYGEGYFSLQEVGSGESSFTAFIATPGIVSYA